MTRSKTKAKAKKRASMQGSSSSSASRPNAPSAATPSADDLSESEVAEAVDMLKEYLVEKVMSLRDDKEFTSALEERAPTAPAAFKDLVYGIAALALLSTDSELGLDSALPAVPAPSGTASSKSHKPSKTKSSTAKGYKSKIHLNVSDRLKTDHPPGTMLFTTIPSRNITDPLDPDGHTEWWCDAATKAKVVHAPGYLKPVPKPKSSSSSAPAYVVRPHVISGRGLGVFAVRDIRAGELVWAERPLLVAPRSSVHVMNLLGLDEEEAYDDGRAKGKGKQKEKEKDKQRQMAVVMLEWERQLEVALGRMREKDREAFMALSNCHSEEDGCGPILGILRTNGFDMSEKLFDGERLLETRTNGYSGVVKIGSRINHSCVPNIEVDFSLSSFSFQFIAQVDIKAGEELLYSYCDFRQSASARQAALASYGFTCDCPACTQAMPEAHKLRPS